MVCSAEVILMVDFMAYPFMQRALVAGLLLSALSGYYGVFLVQRKLSFLGAGLGHAAFGGIALGLLLGIQPLWIALPFTVVVAAGISWVKSHTKLSGDTAIGIFFSVSVALGILFLSLKSGQQVDAFSYLFGSILSVGNTDVWISACLALVGIVTLKTHWAAWAYASFDEEAARIEGLSVRGHDTLLTVLIAITIVLSVKIVGILLVAAWMVIPAAAGRLLAPTFKAMTLSAIAFSAFSAVLGLYLSYLLDLPSGAVIVLVQSALFIFAVVLQRSWSK